MGRVPPGPNPGTAAESCVDPLVPFMTTSGIHAVHPDSDGPIEGRSGERMHPLSPRLHVISQFAFRAACNANGADSTDPHSGLAAAIA